MTAPMVPGQIGIDRAGMEGDHHRLRVAARHFYRGSVDQLVQRRFGRAVAIPTAQVVVTDRAYPR